MFLLRFLAPALALLVSTTASAGVRLAVVPFDNGGEAADDQLGLGLQSMLTTDLSQDDQVTVVERARLQDLLTEMDLAKKGVVDPVTAAKVGRVAGATHVVAGSYTVVGAQMRLDARLTNVQDGTVAGTATASGERDAFFELEKDLVKQLLKAVGAELTPKERAAISKIHTADFDAFRDFSKGVALFDAERFDEALQVLNGLTESDSSFDLAALTAADVSNARKAASAKAQAARVTEAEAEFASDRISATWEAKQFEALRKVAFDANAAQADRVSAANYLMNLSGKTSRGSFHELRDVTDNFALRRVGDRAFQVTWSLLDPEIPRWFPRYSGFGGGLSEERGWDSTYVIERTRSYLFESKHVSQTLADCKNFDIAPKMLTMLWLPKVQALDAYRDQVARGARCEGLEPERVRNEEREIAGQYLKLGELGKATAILDALRKEATDAGELEYIARDLKYVQDKAALLEKAKSPEAKEYVRFGLRWASDLEKLPHMLHYRLRRNFHNYDPFYLGSVPAWFLARGEGLGSGPRTGIDVSRSLRHYGDTRTEFGFDRTLGEPLVLVLDGLAKRDGTAAVQLNFTPAPEWRAHVTNDTPFEPLKARPRVGILVGMTDVETRATCDPVDKSKKTHHPLTAIGAYVDGDALVIAQLRGIPDDRSCGSTPKLDGIEILKVLEKRPIRKPGGELSVKIKGNTVKATLGRVSVSATLEQPVTGFIGLYAEGDGYVELAEPSWTL